MNRRPTWHVTPISAVLLIALTGCQSAMSSQTSPVSGSPRIEPPALTREVPLRFARHDFAAYCFNAVDCVVIYNNHNFGALDPGEVSPPPKPDYKERLKATYIGIQNFPAPAQVRWKSLDGVAHEAQVDIGAIFSEQLIWHDVPKDDMLPFYEGPVAGSPDIMLEVNDRTVSVYTRMFIPTRSERVPGNKHSNYRSDLFLAWSRTY